MIGFWLTNKPHHEDQPRAAWPVPSSNAVLPVHIATSLTEFEGRGGTSDCDETRDRSDCETPNGDNGNGDDGSEVEIPENTENGNERGSSALTESEDPDTLVAQVHFVTY
jgi:hypothetical protein